MNNIAAITILILMGLGFLSVFLGGLKNGDERVLSRFVYYFGLPSIFFLKISSLELTDHVLYLLFLTIVPVVLVVLLFLAVYLVFKVERDKMVLVVLAATFGSYAFYGIPYITLEFSTVPEAQNITVLLAGVISFVCVLIGIVLLELRTVHAKGEDNILISVTKRFSKNPLLLSIILGILFSLGGLKIPKLADHILNTLATTASPVAIFMLGAFFYGKSYHGLKTALWLTVLRMIVMPILASVTLYLGGAQILESEISILIHAMPGAVALMVLSDRYNFYKDTVASFILISSLFAVISLPAVQYIFGIIVGS
jgi:predicted permease